MTRTARTAQPSVERPTTAPALHLASPCARATRHRRPPPHHGARGMHHRRQPHVPRRCEGHAPSAPTACPTTSRGACAIGNRHAPPRDERACAIGDRTPHHVVARGMRRQHAARPGVHAADPPAPDPSSHGARELAIGPPPRPTTTRGPSPANNPSLRVRGTRAPKTGRSSPAGPPVTVVPESRPRITTSVERCSRGVVVTTARPVARSRRSRCRSTSCSTGVPRRTCRR